jgi:hypothetical protein
MKFLEISYMGLKLIKTGIDLEKVQEEKNVENRNWREGKFEYLKVKYKLTDQWLSEHYNDLQEKIEDAKKKKYIRKYNDLKFIRLQFNKNKDQKLLRKYKIPGITIIANYDYMIGVSCYEDLEGDQSKEPYQVQIFIIPDPKIEEVRRFYELRCRELGIKEKKEKEKKAEEGQKIETTLKSFDYYIYQNNLYSFKKSDSYSEQEKKLLIKEHYFKHEKKFQRLQKEIKLFEKLESMEKSEFQQSREPIPEEVRFAVWRRDSGKCVKCGSKEKLEFDHIIPVSKGGSNTERNIQLLCEKCNREKSDKI